jgi:RimJ/RimL family protein N-acetyltransferase
VGVTPPYRIETERLVVRCYEPEDAPLLKEAVDSSIDHLRPWMPWARYEPQTLDEKVELLRRFRSGFDADEDYPYGVFASDESRQIGGAGLHRRGGEGSLEIGYFIRADSIGQGLATEVTAVLARVGIEKCGMSRIDVQVDPENERSLRIPKKLGFTQEAVLRRRLEPKDAGGPRRDSVLFTLVAEELPASPCLRYDYRAFDALGRSV